MVKIRKSLNHKNKNHYNGRNKQLFITIHDTGNQSRGANAEMHRRFIENGSSSTWHYSVDKDEAVQHFTHEIQCWHAGDKRGNGNLNSIGLEMCINSDGDYVQTVKNTVALVQKLMNDLNIPIQNIVQHNHWSGKDCPRQMRNGRNGITWNNFKQMIQTKENVKGDEGLYKVQTGAFTSKENADYLAKRLKEDGYNTFIVFDRKQTVPKTRKKSIKEYADMIERTTITGTKNRAKYLGLTTEEYKPVQAELNRRYS